MIIGIDFDNTIIKYDNVFGRVAIEKKILSDSELKSKNDVKKLLISSDRENDWTELQGIVYGSHIMAAESYENFSDVFVSLLNAGHELKIISHKTKYPFIGKRINLRSAAMMWLKEKGIVGTGHNKLSETDVFFCSTITEKVAMQKKQRCDVFVDDLAKVLKLINPQVNRVLFDPKSEIDACEQFNILRDWGDIEALLNDG
mgnify:FL=1|jgi:hypothetical protein